MWWPLILAALVGAAAGVGVTSLGAAARCNDCPLAELTLPCPDCPRLADTVRR